MGGLDCKGMVEGCQFRVYGVEFCWDLVFRAWGLGVSVRVWGFGRF